MNIRHLILLAFCLLVVSAVSGKQALKISSSGKEVEHTISDDEVNVYGNNNVIKLTGQAEEIDVYGKGNKIIVHGRVDDMDVYGSGNKVQVIGHLKEVDLRGHENRVDCVSVEEIGFTGNSNRLRWAKGERPDVKDSGTQNTVNKRVPK